MDANAKREMARAVEAYVDYCNSGSRTISHDPEWLEKKLKQLRTEVKKPALTWIKRVKIAQRILDYEAELEEGSGHHQVRDAFVEHAFVWAGQQSPPITREAFLELGVPASTLRDAGF